MISSISAVSFKSSAADAISRQGSFTKPAQTSASAEAAPKKKGRFLKGLVGVAAGAIIVGGALLLGYKKGLFKTLGTAEKETASLMQKAGHYLGVAGKWLNTNVWQKLPGIAKKSAAEA